MKKTLKITGVFVGMIVYKHMLIRSFKNELNHAFRK
jgi:hypothetical protein